MRPVTPQPLCPIIVRCEAGGYRAWAVIGAILIGLYWGLVIGCNKLSNISETFMGLDGIGQVSNFIEISEPGQLSAYYQVPGWDHGGWELVNDGRDLEFLDGIQLTDSMDRKYIQLSSFL
jgi:hypothetical protein